jgi:ribosomal protein L37AE/L43A
MKDKFQRFMTGRYGVDELGKYSLYLTIALLIIGLFVRSRFLNGITFILVLVLYFRMFSKNYAQRRKENEIFLKYKTQAVRFFNKEKQMTQDRVKFHIYTCPSCGQKIRIPRGKGKIAITCPKCKTEFIKKS